MPTTYDEVARATSERGAVVLRRRQEEKGPPVLELRVNGVFVMDTLEISTEQALATEALTLVEEPRRVLVGGLGLGFTAGALLGDPRVEEVAVVEIEEALVGWMRDGTVPHGPGVLADRRLRLVVADVRTAVHEATRSYDLVLLDVDNGPEHLVHAANAAVYGAGFLHDVRRLLAPGGLVVVWAANESAALESTMTDVFGGCTVSRLPVVLQGRETEYLLYRSAVPSSP